MRVIPFQLAVSFKRSLRYAPYAILPFFVVLFSFVLGKGNWVTESYKRVVDYKTAYEIPSPFQVKLLNNSLLVEEGTPFLLWYRLLAVWFLMKFQWFMMGKSMLCERMVWILLCLNFLA